MWVVSFIQAKNIGPGRKLQSLLHTIYQHLIMIVILTAGISIEFFDVHTTHQYLILIATYSQHYYSSQQQKIKFDHYNLFMDTLHTNAENQSPNVYSLDCSEHHAVLRPISASLPEQFLHLVGSDLDVQNLWKRPRKHENKSAGKVEKRMKEHFAQAASRQQAFLKRDLSSFKYASKCKAKQQRPGPTIFQHLVRDSQSWAVPLASQSLSKKGKGSKPHHNANLEHWRLSSFQFCSDVQQMCFPSPEIHRSTMAYGHHWHHASQFGCESGSRTEEKQRSKWCVLRPHNCKSPQSLEAKPELPREAWRWTTSSDYLCLTSWFITSTEGEHTSVGSRQCWDRHLYAVVSQHGSGERIK